MASTIEHFRATAYGDSLVVFSTDAEATDTDSTWIHIAPFGNYKGHPEGEFTFTKANVDTIIANYESQMSDSMVDYEHNSLDKAMKGPKLAAGWVKQLTRRADGLWALVEFVKKAADLIRSKEIKYVSPAIDFKTIDRKTNKNIGPSLINIALTNMPFLDGLTPITLTRFTMGDTIKTTESKTIEQPAKQLELTEETVQAQDEVIDANAAVEALAAASGLDPAAVVAALLDKQEEIAAMLVGTAEEEGAPAEEAEATQQVQATQVAALADNTIVAMSQRIKDLEHQEADRKFSIITDKVDKLIEDGYCLDNDKNAAIFMFQNKPEMASTMFSVPRVPINTDQGSDTNKGTKVVHTMTDLSAQEQMAAGSLRAMKLNKITERQAIDNIVAGRKSN